MLADGPVLREERLMDSPNVHSDARRPLSTSVVVGLLLALFGIPLVGELNFATRFGVSTVGAYLVSDLTKWAVVAGLIALVVFWEDRPLTSIGLEVPDGRQIAVAIGVGLGTVVLGLLVTGVAVVALGLGQPDALSAVSRLPLWVKVILVVTAAITEELVWRSYPIERLTELTGRVWVGAAVSAVVFLAIHFPAWGLIGAIPQAVFTLILVGVYVWSRNVVVSIVTHGVINALMILVLPVML